MWRLPCDVIKSPLRYPPRGSALGNFREEKFREIARAWALSHKNVPMKNGFYHRIKRHSEIIIVKKNCLKGLERLMLEISYNYYYCYDPQVFFKSKVFKRWMDSLRMVALILEIRDFSTQI